MRTKRAFAPASTAGMDRLEARVVLSRVAALHAPAAAPIAPTTAPIAPAAPADQAVHALFKLSLPKVKLPTIKVPKIKLPKLPSIKIPPIKLPPIGDPSVELWGTGGRAGFPASAAIMQARNANRPGGAISAADKAALRPRLGSIVDRVTVYYGADPLNAWGAGSYTVKLGGAEAGAQTFGRNIYVRSSLGGLSDRDRLSTLIHELTHAQQYERFGSSLSNFGYEYFKAYKKGGLSYEANKLEKDAYAQQNALTGPVYAAFQAAKPGTTTGTTVLVKYTLTNDSGETVRVKLSPSGNSYTLAPAFTRSFSSKKVNGKAPTLTVLNTGRTYDVTAGAHRFVHLTAENRVGFI